MRDSLGADADDLIVQAMVSPGVDVRIRCDHDDQLGAIVTVGAGALGAGGGGAMVTVGGGGALFCRT